MLRLVQLSQLPLQMYLSLAPRPQSCTIILPSKPKEDVQASSSTAISQHGILGASTASAHHDNVNGASAAKSNFISTGLIDVLNNHPRKIDYSLIMRQHTRIKNSWPLVAPAATLSHPEFCDVYQRIKDFNLPNFLGARIPLNSAINIDKWEELLSEYHDSEICVFLKYGWPVGYDISDVGGNPSHIS